MITKKPFVRGCKAGKAFIFAFLMVLSACVGQSGSGGNVQQGDKNGGKGEKPLPFTTGQFTAAEKALAGGIHIEDPQGDFYQFPPGAMEADGRPDNEHPYPLPFTDLRSVSIGADEDYLYVKYQYWDKFPSASVIYDGDLIWDVGGKLEQFSFTGADGKPGSGSLSTSVNLAVFENGQWRMTDKPQVGQMTMLGEVAQDVFSYQNGAGLVGGGTGQDYLLSAFPLKLFGLKPGDKVTFSCSTETGSASYHHECLDFLLGRAGTKYAGIITYHLGSAEYKATEYKGDNKPQP
jgi:hypothetical protein